MKGAKKTRLFASLTTLTRGLARYLAEPSGRAMNQLKGAIDDLRGQLDPVEDGEFLDSIEILEAALSDTVKTGSGEDSLSELVGTFATKLTCQVAEEMGKRNIPYRLAEHDSFVSRLYVPLQHLNEATAVLDAVKEENKRVRV